MYYKNAILVYVNIDNIPGTILREGICTTAHHDFIINKNVPNIGMRRFAGHIADRCSR